MLQRKVLLALVTAVAVGALWVGQAVSQQNEGGDRQPRTSRGQRSPEEMRRRMEEWRARAAEQMREDLGASEEEWKVLQPMIEKVQTQLRQSRMGMRGMMGRFGGRGRRAGSQADVPRPTDQTRVEREQTDLEKQTEALRQLLTNKEASPAAIKSGLGDVRKERDKAEKQLSKAREELRGVVTVRQEAQLVLMWILD